MSPSRAGEPRTRRWPLVAYLASTTLAVVLWCVLSWQVASTAFHVTSSPRATGDVMSCPAGPMGPGCTVRFVDPDGQVVTRPIDVPGLVGVAPGDMVTLWVDEDGRVGPLGWRPWVDAAVWGFLAVTMTSGAVRWFERVLRAGDPLSRFDLGEDEDGLDVRRTG